VPSVFVLLGFVIGFLLVLLVDLALSMVGLVKFILEPALLLRCVKINPTLLIKHFFLFFLDVVSGDMLIRVLRITQI
jgi:hypothetical protein